ncbi:pleckstrin homology domain-containing family N member 1 isoform X1 [Ornithorhynchus anatinus]|uniref:Pleckstrin homology domain containing N1 n=1 Tax=Ornithorhynchus anatinus TaxID=9258 RepID=A0A6I8NGK5_ORNAN|nr:pleckstrin homology domain-containing family N member 1 isoform X1 [Ornithorhynchus anatinus]
MGNSSCVPQAPARFRSSFSRKPSLKAQREDSLRKLTGLFGGEAGQERDTTADKILYYIPGRDIAGQEEQRRSLDQRFPSVSRKGHRRTSVRNLGSIVHYAKVKFKFQHCQEVNDCYLELFQNHLHFQALSPEGLTYQGLLPLKDLSISRLATENHTFQITGPLLNPLLVQCPSELELCQWLFHLQKQIELSTGPHAHRHSPSQVWETDGGVRQEALRWSVQHQPVLGWEGGRRETLGDILCVSKVKLQHLPFQEQHNRLLVLYPSTLVIISEEPNGLHFKGELPLNSVQLNFEEDGKQIRSFLIEGRLINTIRVTCGSYEDYQDWLQGFRATRFRNGDSSLSGSDSFSGSRLPNYAQFSGSGRGSLTSDGRTNSWASGGRAAPSSHPSQTSGSLPDQSLGFLMASRLAADPLPPSSTQPVQGQADSGGSSTGRRKSGFRRGGSGRISKGKHERLGQADPGHLEPERGEGPALGAPLRLDLSNLHRCSLEESEDGSLEKPQSPLYADPYTPTSTTRHKIMDVSFMEEYLKAQSRGGPEPLSSYPVAPVLVPKPDVPHAPAKDPPLHVPWREPLRRQRGHSGSFKERRPSPQDNSQLTAVSGRGDSLDSLLVQRSGGGERGRAQDGSGTQDYAELQSGRNDLSYDNVWEPQSTAPPSQRRLRPGSRGGESRFTQWI